MTEIEPTEAALARIKRKRDRDREIDGTNGCPRDDDNAMLKALIHAHPDRALKILLQSRLSTRHP